MFFPLILNYSVRSLYSHTNSYDNDVTQLHVDGAQRAWAICGLSDTKPLTYRVWDTLIDLNLYVQACCKFDVFSGRYSL